MSTLNINSHFSGWRTIQILKIRMTVLSLEDISQIFDGFLRSESQCLLSQCFKSRCFIGVAKNKIQPDM
jgi:hypothetical protein